MAINDDGWKQIQDNFAAKGVHLCPLECKVLDALLGRERVVPQDHIVDHIYWDSEDGGPLLGPRLVHVVVCRLRKLLPKSGIPWRIVTHYTMGYQLRYGVDEEV